MRKTWKGCGVRLERLSLLNFFKAVAMASGRPVVSAAKASASNSHRRLQAFDATFRRRLRGCARMAKKTRLRYRGLAHPKGVKDAAIVDDATEQEKQPARGQETEHHSLDDMPPLVVADLVREHADQLVGAVVFDQGVEKGDALVAAEAGEKAFDFVDRFDPSMTTTSRSGNSHFSDMASMAVFSSPSASGSNL